MLSDMPYRMRIENWHLDRKRKVIEVSKRGGEHEYLTRCLPADFALFLYIRPDIKVKLNSIVIFRVKGITFPFFYDHPLVTEKGRYLDRLVVTEFYILQSVPLLQAFQILIITADVAISKSGIQCSTMYTLRNLPVRIERLFDWSPNLLFFGQIRFYRFG